MADLIRNRMPALPSVSVLAVILAGMGAMALTLVESTEVGAHQAGALIRSLGLVLPHAAVPTLERADMLGLLAVVLFLAVSVSVVLAAFRGFETDTTGDDEDGAASGRERPSVL